MWRKMITQSTRSSARRHYGGKLIAVCLTLSVAVLTACGGGSSSSSSSGDTGGTVPKALSSYVMPDEISAVPTAGTQDASRVYQQSLFRALSRSAAGDLPADSDYHKADTRKYVEEHTLEQFDILEQVLTALNQTNYKDQIGEPAYKAMVVEVGDDKGQQAQKKLTPWVVEVDIIDLKGNVVEPKNTVEDGDYNLRVRCWLEEVEKDEISLVRAEFVITSPPTENADGSFADYGEWHLNVRFGDSDDDFFAATCTTGDDGGNVITLHEKFADHGPSEEFTMEVAGVMHRNESQGYGKVRYPDWEKLHGPDAEKGLTEMPYTEAVYAYNDVLLAVQTEDASKPTYKSRADEPVEITHRYGVFDGVTGEDVHKTKSFGFPFYYKTDSMTKRGYYGAWQGRHQVWTDGESLPAEGTVLIREDYGDPDNDPQTYKMGPTFDGTFVMRSYAQAQMSDILNMPVETWINQNYQLTYENSKWMHCPDVDWGTNPPSCRSGAQDFAAVYGWDMLTKNENDRRKHINIGGWDQTANGGNGEHKNYVYLKADTIGSNAAGFYEAEQSGHEWVVKDNPLTLIDPNNVPQLWVDIGGSIYVEWNGTGWVEKEVIFYDDQHHKPKFGAKDKPYTLPEGRELYLNLQGANYVVRTKNGKPTIKVELQTAANPANVTSGGDLDDLAGYTFREPWADNNSTYTFDTDPLNDDTFLMLVYATIGDNDKDQQGLKAGDVVEKDIWGIVAYSGSTQITADGEPLAFNWEYDSDGPPGPDNTGTQDWGGVTYILNADNTYALLDDPIRFATITAENNAGESKTLALQYDTWMMGLPDMHHELMKNGWEMTPQLADKIINLAPGIELTDVVDDTPYILKPLETSQFLPVVKNPTGTLPDVDQADIIDLVDGNGQVVLDIYTAPDMGDMPSNTTLLYSEGKPVTD